MVTPATRVSASAAASRSSASSRVSPVRDELRDHRVVGDRHLVSGRDAGIDANAVGETPARVIVPAWGRKRERVLGVQARLDRVALGIPRLERERLPGRDEQLLLHEVDAGDELRDGMLDLDPRVQLEEGEAAVLAEDELGRARALVAQRAGERDGGVAHLAAQRGVDGGGGALLEHLLVAALDRAVALAQREIALPCASARSWISTWRGRST